MTDENVRKLLTLLREYVDEYGTCANMKISEVAEDLAMSMDETTNEDNETYLDIIAITGEE